MNLSSIDSARGRIKVILLQSSSETLKMFIKDKVKKEFECNQDTTFEINNKKELRKVKEFYNVQPPFAKRWLVYINLEQYGRELKELKAVIDDSTTVTFFCISTKYFQYKNFKEYFKKTEFFLDFYVSSLRKDDMLYLYTQLVPSENRLTKQMYDYVAQSYSGDVSATLQLFKALGNGATFNNRKEIADICGIGGNSIESFIISLLKPPSQTERGLKIVMKNRMRAGYELSQIYKWGTFYSYMQNTLSVFIDIKLLCISGSVYKRLSNLPEGYDENKISRKQRYLWRLKEIPLSRLVRLKFMLGNERWKSDLDFLGFLYTYIKDLVSYEVLNKED